MPEEQDESPKKKQKVEAVRPVAPILIGRPEPSQYDKMMELQWKGLIQSSSTQICCTNYNEKLTSIFNVDLKTRRRTITK